MEIQKLKSSIEQQIVNNDLIIFVGNDFFIAEQYYKEIAKQHNLEIKSTDDLTSIILDRQSLFYVPDNYLYIVRLTDLVDFDYDMLYTNNIIILTNKIKDHLKTQLARYIVKLPELEEWQLKDYLLSTCEGANENQLNDLFELTKNNPYRLQQEIDKLVIFDNPKNILDKCFEDNMYSDLSNYTAFDLTNAIMKRDKQAIIKILKNKDNIDINALGIVSILHTQFRNLALVFLTNSASPITTGLTDKQLYAIRKYQSGYYTGNQIVEILLYLDDINKNMLIGNINMENLLELTICKVLSC